MTLAPEDFQGWRKSSYSGDVNTSCVEVAFAVERVGVRDSKNTSGPTLSFSPDAWRTFARTTQPHTQV